MPAPPPDPSRPTPPQPDTLPDRRRPGPRPEAPSGLLPLLRYRPSPRPAPLRPRKQDDLAPARGILRAALIGAALWAALIATHILGAPKP